MTPTEAITLARLTVAACPAQTIDEYTPDIWFDLLGDLDFEEARLGMIAAAKKSPFVAPAEIRAEVAKVHRERARHYVVPAIPNPDDTVGYRQTLLAANKAAGMNPSGAIAIAAEADAVTQARARQFREHGYKPFLSGAGPVARGSGVESAVEAARNACLSASARIHDRDPAEDLTDAERTARELARKHNARPRKSDPGGLNIDDMRDAWRGFRANHSTDTPQEQT